MLSNYKYQFLISFDIFQIFVRNYPIQLLIAPLIGAISGGNCIILKPSELANATSKIIAKLIPQYMDQNAITVIEGDVEISKQLLTFPYDLIFFTGSTMVGKHIMTAAAKHLTPVILELGGKSPVYVHSDVNIDVTVKRIIWGKFYNTSQTCIAPDYVMVHENIKDKFIQRLLFFVKQFYPDPYTSTDYGNNKKKKNTIYVNI
jgi:aldehyde dehydrogenase (NAD+)